MLIIPWNLICLSLLQNKDLIHAGTPAPVTLHLFLVLLQRDLQWHSPLTPFLPRMKTWPRRLSNHNADTAWLSRLVLSLRSTSGLSLQAKSQNKQEAVVLSKICLPAEVVSFVFVPARLQSWSNYCILVYKIQQSSRKRAALARPSAYFPQ